MNREQKSLTNKGFSLVELIIVVAIMAILIGVLAPQYLRYVEKSRLQKDNTSIGEVANVLKMASAEETVITALNGTTATYSFSTTGMTVSGVTALDNEVEKTIDPTEVKITSTTYTTGGAPTLYVTSDSSTNIVTVTATGWKTTSDDSGSNKTF